VSTTGDRGPVDLREPADLHHRRPGVLPRLHHAGQHLHVRGEAGKRARTPPSAKPTRLPPSCRDRGPPTPRGAPSPALLPAASKLAASTTPATSSRSAWRWPCPPPRSPWPCRARWGSSCASPPVSSPPPRRAPHPQPAQPLALPVDESYSSYHPAGDYPLVRVLRDPVYVEVRLLQKTDPNLVLVLHHCWASPSPNAAAEPQWPILVDG